MIRQQQIKSYLCLKKSFVFVQYLHLLIEIIELFLKNINFSNRKFFHDPILL